MGKDAAGTDYTTVAYWGRILESIPASYTIWKDGSTYRAECNIAGGTDYSGTDASTVIQAAIDALSAGGKILIRKATYYATALILHKANIEVEMEDGAIIRDTSALGLDGLYVIRGSNTILRGGTLDGNAKSNSLFVIDRSPGDPAYSNILVENVHVKNVKNGHLGWLMALWDVDAAYELTDVTIRNCRFTDDPETTMDNIAVSFCQGVVFENCLFDLSKAVCVFFSKDVQFINCVFQNFSSIASLALTGRNFKVIGCTFKGDTAIPVLITAGTDAHFTDFYGNALFDGCSFEDGGLTIKSGDATHPLVDVTVKGCTFYNDGITLGSGAAQEQTKHIVITDNIFHDLQGSAIYTDNYVEELIVTGNQVINANLLGAAWWSFCLSNIDNMVVSGNLILDDQDTATSFGIVMENTTNAIVSSNRIENTIDYAIKELGTADYNLIHGNIVYDNAHAIWKIGANSVSTDNIES
jgi:polygalacturonase